MQELLPGIAYVPPLQSVHSVDPAVAAFPTSQSRQAVWPVEIIHRPAVHLVHSELLSPGATVPPGQAVHSEALALPAKRPTGQARQKVDLGCQV